MAPGTSCYSSRTGEMGEENLNKYHRVCRESSYTGDLLRASSVLVRTVNQGGQLWLLSSPLLEEEDKKQM